MHHAGIHPKLSPQGVNLYPHKFIQRVIDKRKNSMEVVIIPWMTTRGIVFAHSFFRYSGIYFIMEF